MFIRSDKYDEENAASSETNAAQTISINVETVFIRNDK